MIRSLKNEGGDIVQPMERRRLILDTLRKDGRVYVSELSRVYRVSEETIRRDLERLEQDGHASRNYGGASLNGTAREDTPYDIRKRADINAKQIIARLVAREINDGDYIIIDESSTSYYISKAIKGKKNLTVITNSMEIIQEIAGTPGWTILCTGGTLRPSAPVFAGHQAENMLKSYHVDKAIISCGSLDINAGYTDRHEDTALIKRAMMSAARQVILAADATKFDSIAFSRIGALSELSVIVTDAEPDAKWKSALEDLGVTLIYNRE